MKTCACMDPAAPNAPPRPTTVEMIGAGLLIVAVVWHGLRPIIDLDLWWQIKLGEQIVATHTLVSNDPFSYTVANAAWPYKDAGAGLVAYGLWSLGGAGAIVIAKALLFVATGGSLWFLLRHLYRIPWSLCVLASVVAMDSIAFRFTERSASFALLATVVLMILIERDRRGHGGLGWAPLLCAVVANLHRSVLLFPPLLAVHAGVLAVEAYIDGKPRPWQRAGLIAFLSGLACLATPFGIRIITTTSTLVGEHAELITEWAPVSVPLLWNLTPATFLVIFGLPFAAAVLLRRSTRNLWLVAMSVTAIVVGLQALRHVPYLALFGIVPLTMALARWPSLWTGSLRGFIAAGAGAIGLAAQLTRPLAMPALGLAPAHYPDRGVDFVAQAGESQRLEGRVFNEFGYGGYLIFHLWPQHRVYIDGRTDLVYPASFVADYAKALTDGAAFAREARRWNIQWIFIDNAPHRRDLLHFDHSPDWTLVHGSRRALVYVRTDGPNAALARTHGYRWLWPHDLAGSIAHASTRGHGADAIAELKRMNQEDPENPYPVVALMQLGLGAPTTPTSTEH